MATGDNLLTAISVARKSAIVGAESDIFLGDLKKEEDGSSELCWKKISSPIPSQLRRDIATGYEAVSKDDAYNEPLVKNPLIEQHGAELPWNYLDN